MDSYDMLGWQMTKPDDAVSLSNQNFVMCLNGFLKTILNLRPDLWVKAHEHTAH